MKGLLRGRIGIPALAAALGAACATGGGGSDVAFDGGLGGDSSTATGGTGALPPAGGGPAGGGSSGDGGMSGGTTGTGATGTGATTSGGTAGSATGGLGGDSGVDSSSGGTTGSDASTAYGDCCSSHGTPGCTDTNVQKCVCNVDATCCAIAWNAECVLKAYTYNCAACPDGGVTSGGGTGGGGAGGDCCVSHSTPGCGNAAVQACVCAVDSYCCTYSWDSLCASEVTSEGCGTC